MKHTCHAEGCTKEVPPKMFSCRSHWFALPKRIRDLVWRYYVPGQEIRKNPTAMYLVVQAVAVAWLAFAENRWSTIKATDHVTERIALVDDGLTPAELRFVTQLRNEFLHL